VDVILDEDGFYGPAVPAPALALAGTLRSADRALKTASKTLLSQSFAFKATGAPRRLG
jgi:hypothetical protein